MAYIVRGLCDVVKYGKQKFNLKINMMRNENMNTLQDSQSCKTRVSKSAFDKLNLNMNKNWSKYLSAKGSLEAYLSDFIDFDFSINDMPGDGFVVLDYQRAKSCV